MNPHSWTRWVPSITLGVAYGSGQRTSVAQLSGAGGHARLGVACHRPSRRVLGVRSRRSEDRHDHVAAGQPAAEGEGRGLHAARERQEREDAPGHALHGAEAPPEAGKLPDLSARIIRLRGSEGEEADPVRRRVPLRREARRPYPLGPPERPPLRQRLRLNAAPLRAATATACVLRYAVPPWYRLHRPMRPWSP